MDRTKKKILLFIDWFLPGYRAGGPIQSCVNLIEHLKDDFEFSIVTRNTDYGEVTPYSKVQSDAWNILQNGMRVYYISSNKLRFSTIRKLIRNESYDILYLNGIYSLFFTLLPLFYARSKPTVDIVISARGMLASGAMSIKKNKKHIFLKLAKNVNFFKNVVFHATNEVELADIQKQLGGHTRVRIAENLPKAETDISAQPKIKHKDVLKLIYVGRISPEKNILFALQLLQQLTIPVVYDLYGPIHNTEYWAKCIAVIKRNPSHIKVKYNGSLANEKVAEKFQQYDFLFTPTLGENFGHSILEALNNGCPVIISDRTPWKHLQESNVGWDIPLNKPDNFIHTFETCAKLTPEQYTQMVNNARAFSSSKLNLGEVIKKNKELFFFKKRILILTDWYLPAYKAGGPVKSISQLIHKFSEEFDFYLVARDRDLGDRKAFDNIVINKWIYTDEVKTLYLSPSHLGGFSLYKIIKETRVQAIYVNGIFSWNFSILPVLLNLFFKRSLVLAPRGMLGSGALSINKFRKKLFLTLFKPFYKDVTWHASTSFEEKEIRVQFPNAKKITVALNIPYTNGNPLTEKIKPERLLKLVFLSRISRKKNIHFMLDVLQKISPHYSISLDIYGPIEDKVYWKKCEIESQKLPTHIHFQYKGIVPSHETFGILEKYHLMFLPTLNENFGHAIIESFSVGTPVIISDQTPWKNLKKHRIGWDIPLGEPGNFVQAIEEVADMNQNQYIQLSKNAYAYAQIIQNDTYVIEQNRKLFLDA